MADMCHSCYKRIDSDSWWSGYKEPKTHEEALAIMKSKSTEIIICKECQEKLFRFSELKLN
jgi:hypothetical protein